MSIQEKPENPNPSMNIPFRSMKLLAINAKMKNTGQDRLVVNRYNITLTTKDGRIFVPLSKSAAADCDKGPFNIYRFLSIRSVSYGYYAFGLDEHIVLNPGEEKSGYLFYRVSKYYDQAKEADVRILFYRISSIHSTELRLKLGEGKGE